MTLLQRYREDLLLSMCQSQFGLFRNGRFLEVASTPSGLSNYSLQTFDMNVFGDFLRSVATGACDANPKLAALRAIYEGLERSALIFHDPFQIIKGKSFREISEIAYSPHPGTWSLGADWQYEDSDFPLAPYTQDLSLDWIPVSHAWRKDTLTVVPSSFVLYAQPRESCLSKISSNGASFHWDREMARLSATLELIERDSLMIHWRSYTAPIQIDLKSIQFKTEPRWFAEIAHQAASFKILLLKNEFSVPVICTVFFGRDPRSEPPVAVSTAAALQLETAVTKSLLEICQHVVNYRVHQKSFQNVRYDFRNADSEVLDFNDHRKFYYDPSNRQALDFLLKGPGPVDWRELSSIDLQAPKDLAELVNRFKEMNYDLMFKEFRTPELARLGATVTRAISPKLIPLDYMHKARCLGTNRFQTVPRMLGSSSALDSAIELNPFPHPLP